MRYSGGLLGGSWLTALTGDLGAGRFDGAWLVQNFENLNPANTLWTKQYDLFSKVDTERERYLGFEKYWGGHVFMNDVEMQYIVDNLFIGNKLSTAELMTSDGIRIDLRNIRSPILVFCSKGDNISPPPQALGWITDLYLDDEDVRAHDQTIIYALHDSIGHLGIFVSGSIGRKEHKEFEANIDFLDVLPSGIYQANLQDKGPDTPQSGSRLWRLRAVAREAQRGGCPGDRHGPMSRATGALPQWHAFRRSTSASIGVSSSRGFERRHTAIGAASDAPASAPRHI